jgi:hypothetical protein
MNRYLLSYQKTVNVCYLIAIAITIAIPDIILGLLLELVHHFFEIIHLIFEIFEASLDHIIEHIFHTGMHETQVIVFYLIMCMVCGVIYYISKKIPRFFRKIKKNTLSILLTHKTKFFLYWEESASNKFKVVAFFNACFIYFFIFAF